MTTSRQLDEAAFGVVYGSITVLSLLMATQLPIESPAKKAGILFLSVFAVAVAKAYAEICDRMLKSGQNVTWHDIGEVWGHSRTVLIAANGPTLAFMLAAVALVSPDFAFLLAQLLAFGLLAYFGARIGWNIGGNLKGAIVGAGLTSCISLMIGMLKFLAH